MVTVVTVVYKIRHSKIHIKNDVYIVRLDEYKAMIEISDTSMRELAKI